MEIACSGKVTIFYVNFGNIFFRCAPRTSMREEEMLSVGGYGFFPADRRHDSQSS